MVDFQKTPDYFPLKIRILIFGQQTLNHPTLLMPSKHTIRQTCHTKQREIKEKRRTSTNEPNRIAALIRTTTNEPNKIATLVRTSTKQRNEVAAVVRTSTKKFQKKKVPSLAKMKGLSNSLGNDISYFAKYSFTLSLCTISSWNI